MSNAICLNGPGFVVSGDVNYDGTEVAFQAGFDSAEEGASVLAFEWFLDNLLVTDQLSSLFSANVSCGKHTIGLRILGQNGWSGIKDLIFETCNPVTSLIISGPAEVQQGNSAIYSVTKTLADGTVSDLTSQYTFSGTNGSFSGTTYTANADGALADESAVITATPGSGAPLTKNITITPYPVSIQGSDTVTEGQPASFKVMRNATEDVTGLYTLSSPDGSFQPNGTFTAFVDNSTSTKPSVITAARSGAPTLTKPITINPIVHPPLNGHPGVIVVDLYDNTSLNVIAYIENQEVVNNHSDAYTGNNFVPANSEAAAALLLASDVISGGTLSWRFEVNLGKLLSDYPSSPQFVFVIAGRGNVAGSVSGAYGIKTTESTMTMTGTPGSYIPSISGSNLADPVTISNAPLAGGANGSYNEADLQIILRFTYVVATHMLTYTTFSGGDG